MKNELVLGLVAFGILVGFALVVLGPMLASPNGQLLMSIFK